MIIHLLVTEVINEIIQIITYNIVFFKITVLLWNLRLII